MEIVLSGQAEQLLRAVQARHPDQSPAELIEQALAGQLEREAHAESPAELPRKTLTSKELDRWLNEFAQFSDKIPAFPGDTFSREMIYRDRD